MSSPQYYFSLVKTYRTFFLLAVASIILSFSVVFAATYYVDSVAGSDPVVNGVLTGPVQWTTGGKYGNALVFDGGLSMNATSYVDLGSNIALKPSQFTISAWMFASTTANPQSIFKPAYSDGWVSGFLLFVETNGSIIFRYGNNSSHVGSFSTSGVDYRNAWHLVTASYDGTTTTLYVDGVAKTSAVTSSMQYNASPSSAWVGGSNGINSFYGILDDIRLYGRALTLSEIQAIYNNANIPASNLIFHLPFEEGSGLNTRDPAMGDGSLSLPWKTLSQVGGAQYQPGDSILLKRGESWNETLTIPSSGSPGSPITIGVYGSGAKPIITGSTAIAPSNWVVCGASCNDPHIYVASTTFSEPLYGLFVDDQKYDIAHYPDTTNPYIMTTSDSSTKNYIVSTNFNPPSVDLVGADVYLRTNSWTIENRKITSYDAGAHTLNLDSNTGYAIASNYGFYLSNKLWMLDHPGEWYYSTTTNNLYVWMSDGSNPASHTVEVSPWRYGVVLTNKHDVNIQDLTIKNTTGDGFRSNYSSNLQINNLNISYAGGNGMYFSGDSNTGGIQVASSTVDHAVTNGIVFSSIASTTASSIVNNSVTNTGIFNLPVNSYGAIQASNSRNVSVINNTISNTNYIGITFSGNTNIIENNYINNSCMVLDDCGGIYTWGNYGTGNIIDSNIITNSIGNFLGTPQTTTQSEGIYLDDNSNGNTITNNTTNNTHKGIFVHNSSGNQISGNTLYNSRESALVLQEDSIVPAGVTYNNNVTHNIFFNTSTTTPSVKFNAFLGHSNLGTYDFNTYTGTYFGSPLTQTLIGTTTSYSLNNWKTASSQDLNSNDLGSFFSVLNSKILSYLAPNFVTNETFDATTTPWDKWSSDNSAVISWVPSCGLDGGCLHGVTSSTGSLVLTNNFSLQQGVLYSVSFDVISNNPINGAAIVRHSSSPWNNYAAQGFVSNSSRQNISFTFVSDTTITNDARMDLEVNSGDFYIDNVSIRPITLFKNDMADDSVLYTNPTTSTTTISLGSNRYCDLNNLEASSSFTLAPFSSKIVFSCFNNNDSVCNNHETHDTAPTDCPLTTDEGSFAGDDAPHTMGTEKINNSGTTRIYGQGKFRTIATTTSLTADLSIAPVSGFTSSTSELLDVTVATWNTSGDYSKSWTESSAVLGTASTTHTVGDLKANTWYIVKRDGVEYATTTSNGSGKITFIYTGGYSTHTFSVIENPVQPATDACGTQAGTIQLTKPTGSNACSAGSLNSATPIDSSSAWNWTCGALSCSASKAGCNTSTDTNYSGAIPANTYTCALTCANGGTNYPTCSPPSVAPVSQSVTYAASGWTSSFYGPQPATQSGTVMPPTPTPVLATGTQEVQQEKSKVTHEVTTNNPSSCFYFFSKGLVYHDDNEDVIQLQKFLNSDPKTTVIAKGNGSRGHEISYYGVSTYKAVMKYQALHLKEIGIKEPSGAFLTKTRRFANAGCNDL